MKIKTENLLTAAVKETYEKLLDDAAVNKALQWIEMNHDQTVKEQVEITEIPAPPFKEEKRAQDYLLRLQKAGLKQVQMDGEGNVFGICRGTGEGPTIFVSAHLDTVFPEGTDTKVTEEDGILFAPGIGDDTRGLAELLAIIRALQEANIPHTGDILFGGTVGEEGAGDLRGVKAFFQNNRHVDAFLSLDGPGENEVVYLGTGSYRYTITFKGPGGHSFGDFGMPSAAHALGRAIAHIAELRTKDDPKTTFTVGEVWGGASVNAIAQEAGMNVDLRSNSQEELDRLAEKFLAIVHEAALAENKRWGSEAITVEIEQFGIRPPAEQPEDAMIVQAALGSIAALGGCPKLAAACSTDANYPMSLGIPSVTLGLGGRSGGAHTLEEWYDPKDGYTGIQKSFLTILGLAGIAGVSDPLIRNEQVGKS